MLKKMFKNTVEGYENVGATIKGLAIVGAVLEATAAFITGIVLLIDGVDFLYAWFIMFGGPITAWVLSFFPYAFGELVEKSQESANNTRQILEKMNETLAKTTDLNVAETPNKRGEQKAKKGTASKPNGSIRKSSDESAVNEMFDDDNYIDVVCPKCEESLSFLKDEKNAVCPWCDTKIYL